MSARLPLTASDLAEIAKALEPIELLDAIVDSSVIGRIEVYRPGSQDVIGYFDRADGFDGAGEGWYGFLASDGIQASES